jgi:hypothetical protein
MNGCQEYDLEALNWAVKSRGRNVGASCTLPGLPLVAHSRVVILAGFEWFGSASRARFHLVGGYLQGSGRLFPVQ